MAQTYRKQSQALKADEAAAKASTIAPRDPLVQRSLAIYYTESGKVLKAAEAQTAYSQLAPEDAEARTKAEALYFEAVQPLLHQQKFAEAVSVLSKARERLPKSAQLELALGVAYYGMRRFDDAATAFLATIAIAPDIDQPNVFLGKFLDQIPARLPEVTQQFVTYEKALSIHEPDSSTHFELGVLFYRVKRYEDAAREFERSAALDPANPATHYRLSNVYSRLGKHEAAQAERDLHAKLAKAQEEAARK